VELELTFAEYGFLALASIAQATGLAMALVRGTELANSKGIGAAASHPRVSVVPTWQSGPGVSLTLTSW
jgi:hypothetical protein